MRILVTGGAGFIGANFLNLMVPRFPAHHFINLDALTYAGNPASLAGLAGRDNYTFVHGDIADPALVTEVFARFRPETVLHFAAESHVDRSIAAPGAFVRTNVVGTFTLLEACRAAWGDGIGRRFHHVSTDEVYGSLGAHGRFDEESRYAPSSPYSASKAAADHLVRAYFRTYGLPITITNCSNNFGPFQFPEKLVPLMLLNALAGHPLPVYGSGEHIRDWLYVEDHCAALWAVLERGRPGETYNVGADSERTNLQVVHALCELLAEATGAAPEHYRRLIAFVADRPGHDLRYAIDAAKLRRECGWAPAIGFTDGLRRTVRWYLGHGEWVAQVRSGAYRAGGADHAGAAGAPPRPGRGR